MAQDSVRMDRKRTALVKGDQHPGAGFVAGTMAYRIGLMWQLTSELASFNKAYDAERRLQRHVTRTIRGES